MSAPKHTGRWGRARRPRRRTSTHRALFAVTAAVLGAGLIALGSATTTSMALAQGTNDGGDTGSSAPAVEQPGTGLPGTDAPTAAKECDDPLHVSLGKAFASGGSVTVPYTITGCVGKVRLHIHQNLLSGPHAGSDPVNQMNANVDITKNSPTEQTFALLQGVEGKCWIQFDYSIPGERHGIFTPTPNCPEPSTSTPPPSSSVPPSSSTPPPPKSSSVPPPPTSSGVEPTSVTSTPAAPVKTTASQLGPIPHTGFTGTAQLIRSHPYRWATIIGIGFLVIAAAGGVSAFSRRP